MRKRKSGGRGRSRVDAAPGRALLGSLLIHAVLLAVAVVIARAAVAEPSDERDPVRLTFVETAPEVEEPVVFEETAGGGGGGPEATPAEVVEVPPPVRRRRRRRRMPMVREEADDADSREEETPSTETEDLELVVSDGEEEEEAEDDEAVDVDEEVATEAGSGSGVGSGTGPGSGGGTGGGSGGGTGSGTGEGSGPGISAPIFYRAGMERPRLRSGDPPRYTRQAREAGVEGVVTVLILIARSGRVRSVRVISSTVPILDDEVVRAVREWRFSPPMVDGQRVEMYLRQPIRFNRRR